MVVSDEYYTYTTIDDVNHYLEAKVKNTSLKSYPSPQEYVYINDVKWYLTSMQNCFRGCDLLKVAPTIPNAVTNMASCFEGCKMLSAVLDLPSSTLDMRKCFLGCKKLTVSPTIPNGVTDMSACFKGCSTLQSGPTIPSGVTKMTSCFESCIAITSIPDIPESVTAMNDCFYACANLTTAPKINAPDLKGISYLFAYCTSLTGNIYISSGAKIDQKLGVFTGTTNPIKIVVLGSENYTMWPDLISGYSNVSIASFSDIPSEFDFGDYTYSKSDVAFSVKVRTDNKNKTSYGRIFDKINTIWVNSMRECFSICSSLTTPPEIPSSVTNLYSCFSNCTSLATPPEIPSSVTNMEGCFYGCKSLATPPEIPSSVTNIGACFSYCESLATPPEIPSGITNLYYCFRNCISLKTAPEIPSSVIYMNDCFSSCTSLTTPPEIPSGVTNMENCFYNCTSLRTPPPIIPHSVTNMKSCFEDCVSLETPPLIQNGPTNLSYCFCNCTSLTTAPQIIASVTNMRSCFKGCTDLRGNIIVDSAPAIDEVFSGTIQPIFIISGLLSETINAPWRNAASNYSNVHFEADDNPDPSIVMAAGYPKRVTAKGSTETSVTDPWILMQYTVTHSDDILPDGWSALADTLIVKDEATGGDLLLGADSYPTIIKSTDIVADDVQYSVGITTSNVYTIQLWMNTHDVEKYNLSLNVRNVIYNKTNPVYGTDTPKTYNTYILNVLVPRSYPTMDFHSGGEGMGIGTYATEEGQLRIGMDPTWVLDPEVEKDLRVLNAMLNLGWITKPKPTIDLTFHGSWVDSGTVIDGHKVYKSDASYNVANAWDTAKITFTGFETFSIFIRSYGENNYDYVLVSTLNNNYLANRTSTSSMRNLYNDSTYTKAHTRGKASSTTYEEVIFDNLDKTQEYYFYVIYQKDSSSDSNLDRGFFYLGQEEGEPW